MERRGHRRLGIVAIALAILLGPFAAPALAGSAAAEAAKLYLIALDDGGVSGEKVGCGDSLVPVPTEIAGGATTEVRIAQALTRLLALKTRDYGESGYITSLYASNLAVARVTLQHGTAIVSLSGTIALGGVCDDPRAAGQIAATAHQFAGVKNVVIILDGGPLTNAIGSIAFPQTGQTVAPPFYPYWEEQGGLPIFGYPLSAQLGESGFRAQYFERQRFEHHPENQEPYRVLFGLLGLETAQRRGLLDTPPFARATQRSGSTCEYVPTTGHNICAEFRDYWHAHGLDFGEPGYSPRESLALFGLPLSEPFEERLENGQTYAVQYFERARFELHPENAAPYKVLLGRLAAGLVPAAQP